MAAAHASNSRFPPFFDSFKKKKKKNHPLRRNVTRFDTSKTIEQIAWYRARLAKFHRRDFGSALKEASAEAVGRKREGWKALTFKGSRVVFTGTTRRRAEIRGSIGGECSRFPARLLYFPVERVEKEESSSLFIPPRKIITLLCVGRLLVNNVCQITVRFVGV